METRIKAEDVKGWGIDADPRNEPTYPMKKYTGDDHNRLNYQRPPQQPLTVEVLHSNERPNYTAVFGTSTPPTGISGQMRRRAFKYSEDRYPHWMILMMADRVNVIEGIIEDIKNGHFPNIMKERGWKANWKYDTRKTALRTSVFVFSAALLITLFRRRKSLH
jgi:hypothetical protein